LHFSNVTASFAQNTGFGKNVFIHKLLSKGVVILLISLKSLVNQQLANCFCSLQQLSNIQTLVKYLCHFK